MKFNLSALFFVWMLTAGYGQATLNGVPFASIQPRVITDTVKWDTDDPAIWIHPTDPSKSLVIGTDKHIDGALYAFDLNGKTVKTFKGLHRPNNVDITYGFLINGKLVDIAVVTERERQRIRVFRLPDLTPIDNGDLLVFNGDTKRAPMGISLYKRAKDNALFIFVGGKSGPPQNYLGQYRLLVDATGKISIKLVREFGAYSGKKEIESIAVDAELGYVYYSDEKKGVRKYHADPDAADADKELALFADKGFASDHEGISIYKTGKQTGYLLVSDQQANQFWIYSREVSVAAPHEHKLLKIIKVATVESDGNEVTNVPVNAMFPAGLLVTMSNGKTFHYYSWKDIAGKDLKDGGEIKSPVAL